MHGEERSENQRIALWLLAGKGYVHREYEYVDSATRKVVCEQRMGHLLIILGFVARCGPTKHHSVRKDN